MVKCKICDWEGKEDNAKKVAVCPICRNFLKLFIKDKDLRYECPKCLWQGGKKDILWELECPACGSLIENQNNMSSFATIAIHQNDEADLIPPIHQSSTFILGKSQYIYTRAGNPTIEILEEKIAKLEKGESAVAFSSGMAAISATILSCMKSGDRLISSCPIYSGTYAFFRDIKRFGIYVSFVNTHTSKIESLIDENTKIVYIETPANPTMDIIDILEISQRVKEFDDNIKVIVDNTFMTPYFQRPLELGADIVIHSATKFLCGHGDALGGIVIGDKNMTDHLRKILVDYGGVISPFNAWLIIRGIKTLSLRMDRHEKNAITVSNFLKRHEKVRRVLYPGLNDSSYFDIARRQMYGFGGMLAFELRNEDDVYTLLDNVKLCKVAVSLGTTETLIENPYTMTHLNFPEKEDSGISKSLIRLSVGLEDVRDIISDLKQALDK